MVKYQDICLGVVCQHFWCYGTAMRCTPLPLPGLPNPRYHGTRADVDFTQCGDYNSGGSVGVVTSGFFTGCSFVGSTDYDEFMPAAIVLNPNARLALEDCDFAPLPGTFQRAAACDRCLL